MAKTGLTARALFDHLRNEGVINVDKAAAQVESDDPNEERVPGMVGCDDWSTSGFHSDDDSESLFSSEIEEEILDDSDPSFIPPTDSDIDSDNDSDLVFKAVQQDRVSCISESEESQDSVTFPALVQKSAPLTGTLDNTQDPSVIVQCAGEKKAYFCAFCSRPQKRLPRHLLTMHGNEEIVMEYSSCKDEKKKSALLTKIRNYGNHRHNDDVLASGKGIIIVIHRPTDSERNTPHSYVPCPDCYGYFRRSLMYRHACPLAPDGQKVKGTSRVKKGESLLTHAPNDRFSEFQSSFRAGSISLLARTDPLIETFAKAEFHKNGHDPDMHNHIRSKVRTVAKLLLEMRTVVGSPLSLTDCISPDRYEALVDATKRLAGYDEIKQEFKTPSLAKNVGMYIKKCALIRQSDAMQRLNTVEEQKAVQLVKLIELTWNQRISHHALRTLRKRKRNSPSLMPVTSDIVLLSGNLEDKAKRCADILESDPESSHTLTENWRDLNTVTLTQIMMFNRRRQGEVSKMKLTDYTQNTKTSHDEELVKHAFSPLEQALCKKLTRIEIPGKRGRTVPVLLTSAMKRSLELLASSREKVGINPENPYLFPRMSFNSLGHLRGSDCLREEVADCGVTHPEFITTTKLRKQIATISQVVNLKDHELDVLADFMGHDVRIHREFYRLPQQTYQVAKVSKLLLALEKGDLTSIHGKTLDDITVSADDVLDDEDDDDDDEDGAPTIQATSFKQQESGSGACAARCARDGDSDTQHASHKGSGACAARCARDGDSDTQHASHKGSGACAARCARDGDSDNQHASHKGSGACAARCARDGDSDNQHVSHKVTVARKKTKHRQWLSEEKKAVDHHFSTFLLNSKLPGKSCIEDVQGKEPKLAKRTWKNIKDFIRNKIK
ncbi:uncharacterized protein [Littorina saxatilis]|uniref:uncharacterized protein isoform X3 n=1 Tax=Littorina saxatilis TaxID=31220 RepID=UPI0038B4EC4F